MKKMHEYHKYDKWELATNGLIWAILFSGLI